MLDASRIMAERLLETLPVTVDHFHWQALGHIHHQRDWHGLDGLGRPAKYEVKEFSYLPQVQAVEELKAKMLDQWRHEALEVLMANLPVLVQVAAQVGQVPQAPQAPRAPGQPASVPTRAATAEEQTGCRRGYLHHTNSPMNPCAVCGDTGRVTMDPNARIPIAGA